MPASQEQPRSTAAAAAQVPGDTSDSAALEDKLRLLIEQQETRISHLEGLNKRKEEQLLKLHGRLEEALTVLQAGQKMYSEQQKVLDAQQATVEELKACAGIAKATSNGESRRPAAAAEDAGADAEEEDDDDDDEDDGGEFEGDSAEEMAALARRAQELQDQLERLCTQAADVTAADVDAGSGGHVARPPRPELLAAMQPGELEAAVQSQALQSEQAPQLLAHLQAMMLQKDRLESQLRAEQALLEQQLRELYARAEDAGDGGGPDS